LGLTQQRAGFDHCFSVENPRTWASDDARLPGSLFPNGFQQFLFTTMIIPEAEQVGRCAIYEMLNDQKFVHDPLIVAKSGGLRERIQEGKFAQSTGSSSAKGAREFPGKGLLFRSSSNPKTCRISVVRSLHNGPKRSR